MITKHIVIKLRGLVIKFLKIYHNSISLLFPNVCRFTPTCSEYMALAIEQRGIIEGSWMGIKRLMKCHPFHSGGFDPLPHKKI